MAVPKGLLVVPCAFRTDATLRALEIDDSDRLKVLIESASSTIKIVADENTYLNPVGANLRFDNTSLPAGTSNQSAFTVPASQRVQLDSFSFSYTGTVAGVVLRPSIIIAGTAIPFDEISPPVSGKLYAIYCSIIVEENNSIGIRVAGATLNDDLLVVLNYRRIK